MNRGVGDGKGLPALRKGGGIRKKVLLGRPVHTRGHSSPAEKQVKMDSSFINLHYSSNSPRHEPNR